MRRTILLPAVVALVLAFMPAAAADPPETEPYQPTFEYLIEDCGFPILLTGDSKGFVRTFDDREGVFIEHLNGMGHAVLTNLDTGLSIKRNVSGPAMSAEYPDGSWTYTLPGPTTYWGFDDPSLPLVFINQGRWQFVGDAEGNVTYTHVGRIEDICAALS